MLYYKRHIGDYIRDTSHLRLMEHGAYARLMDVYYSRESPLPDKEVYRLVGAASKQEIVAVKAVLTEFWTLTSEGWVQKRCNHEIGKAQEKAEKNRENGKKGGRPPRDKPINNPNGLHSDNKSQTQTVSNENPDVTLSNYPTNQLANKPNTPHVRSEGARTPEKPKENPNGFGSGPPDQVESLPYEQEIQARFPKGANASNWLVGLRNAHRLVEAGLATWPKLVEVTYQYAAYFSASGQSSNIAAHNFFDPDPEGGMHWARVWEQPRTKGQIRQDANIDAARTWLAQSEGTGT